MKQVVEEWITAEFRVEVEQRQKMGPDGPLFVDGKPDLIPVTVLIFIHTAPHEQQTIRIPLGDEAKQKLVQGLTGGIVLPGNGFKL